MANKIKWWIIRKFKKRNRNDNLFFVINQTTLQNVTRVGKNENVQLKVHVN